VTDARQYGGESCVSSRRLFVTDARQYGGESCVLL